MKIVNEIQSRPYELQTIENTVKVWIRSMNIFSIQKYARCLSRDKFFRVLLSSRKNKTVCKRKRTSFHETQVNTKQHVGFLLYQCDGCTCFCAISSAIFFFRSVVLIFFEGVSRSPESCLVDHSLRTTALETLLICLFLMAFP